VNILITGGTGSFGQALIRKLLEAPLGHPQKIIVYSRDELKQHEMRVAGLTHDQLRYFIGDVRDLGRLRRAFRGVDVVVHTAALKQVESCEFNPLEAKKTNIDGTANVIDAALDCNVRKVLMIGTDKAVDPVNLYGASKLVAEKLMVDANAYSGTDGPRFSCTRYGNVISSRGAVLPIFQAQHAAGLPLTVTDPSMSRFVLTLNQGVSFVLNCIQRMRGGEVFVPRLKTVTVGTIAWAVMGTKIEDSASYIVVGRRPGEKQHELLISANEPELAARNNLPFPYGSDTDPDDRLSVDEFRELAGSEPLKATA
jgi:UDP-N-acetylglucosamine 4,6-dehydratase